MIDVTRYERLVDTAIRKWGQGHSRVNREDLRQDCFVHLLEKSEKIEKVEAQSELDAVRYVSKALKHFVLNAVRPASEDLPLSEVDGHLKIEINSRFVDMLSSLSVVERDVLTLLFRDKASEAEVAEQYSQTRKWMRSTKARALKKLKALEDGHGD
jgi:RNA polymerase sigma factor (sigma-70 family)